MRRERNGYSLVEVLIAMAILGSVLLSIMTLFVFGRRNVYSGRQMTRATSVATHVLEDLLPMTPPEVYSAFEIESDTAMATNQVAGVTYANSIVRQTSAADDGAAYFARWMTLLEGERITDGQVTLVFVPADLGTAGDPTTARRMLVRVVVEWAESTRRRQVFLDTVKLNRTIV